MDSIVKMGVQGAALALNTIAPGLGSIVGLIANPIDGLFNHQTREYVISTQYRDGFRKMFTNLQYKEDYQAAIDKLTQYIQSVQSSGDLNVANIPMPDGSMSAKANLIHGADMLRDEFKAKVTGAPSRPPGSNVSKGSPLAVGVKLIAANGGNVNQKISNVASGLTASSGIIIRPGALTGWAKFKAWFHKLVYGV